MNQDMQSNATAARLLSDLPAYQKWDHRPLNRQLRQLVAELDEQTLMSLTAHAVQQITHGSEPARRLPV